MRFVFLSNFPLDGLSNDDCFHLSYVINFTRWSATDTLIYLWWVYILLHLPNTDSERRRHPLATARPSWKTGRIFFCNLWKVRDILIKITPTSMFVSIPYQNFLIYLQELEIVMDNQHISFTTSKIGSLVDVNQCKYVLSFLYKQTSLSTLQKG